jgi:ribosomal-protein-alanine N-acetyltransferase
MSQVIIARARLADAAELIRANLDNREFHAPWIEPFTDLAGFDAWFGQLVTGPNVSLIARERNSGAIVGVFNISQIVWGAFRSAYLGYYGMAAFARRGYMTEALRLTARHAFDEIGLHRLEANIQPTNLASIALARRAGFRKEGFSPQYLRVSGAWRDHERWALLATAEQC